MREEIVHGSYVMLSKIKINGDDDDKNKEYNLFRKMNSAKLRQLAPFCHCSRLTSNTCFLVHFGILFRSFGFKMSLIGSLGDISGQIHRYVRVGTGKPTPAPKCLR